MASQALTSVRRRSRSSHPVVRLRFFGFFGTNPICIADQIVQMDLVKCLLKRLLGGLEGRQHNVGENLGLRLLFLVAKADGTQNIATRHGIPIPSKLITTTRAADAFDDAVVRQRLEHRFQKPRRHP
jgi:hypothetical protein